MFNKQARATVGVLPFHSATCQAAAMGAQTQLSSITRGGCEGASARHSQRKCTTYHSLFGCNSSQRVKNVAIVPPLCFRPARVCRHPNKAHFSWVAYVATKTIIGDTRWQIRSLRALIMYQWQRLFRPQRTRIPEASEMAFFRRTAV